ncbi:hypothetical protein LEP1GSC037_1994 [Leptospira interrogans str. 2006001854]|uniref:Adenosylcobinamide-GDP ribazoletransferase n=1 Tax=Leptospira interrogans str. 2006001854 TaxID=1001590 RepID=M6GUE0_LEPIR|nr:hypothetical protein LEP1GSC037_1994 [Leptospira interrogans str. 2006001854]
MKDSRIGTFGSIGLILSLGLKYLLLVNLFKISPWIFLFTSWFSHSASRWFALLLMMLIPYARENDLSKSKPMIKKLPPFDFALSTFFGCFPAVYFLYQFQNQIPNVLLGFFLSSIFVFILEIILINGLRVLREIVLGLSNKELNFYSI